MIGKDEKPRSKWTGRIVIKYVLLQIPSTVLLVLILVIINEKLDNQVLDQYLSDQKEEKSDTK